VFYSQLLRNQIESGQAVLRKVVDAATLFDQFDDLDMSAIDATVSERMKAGNPSNEGIIREAIVAQKQQSDQPDDLMRREFSLYIGQATQNGYSFQAHLQRGDCCLSFCGDAQIAYPLFTQISIAPSGCDCNLGRSGSAQLW
jgi:hypothetical protein